MMSDMQKLQDKAASAETKSNDYENIIFDLQQQIRSLPSQSEYNSLKRELDSLKTQNSKPKNTEEDDILCKENYSLRQSLEASTLKELELIRKLALKQSEYEQLADSKAELEQRISSITQDLESTKHSDEDHVLELDKAKSILATLRKENVGLKQSVDVLTQTNENLNSQVKAIRVKYEELSEQLQTPGRRGIEFSGQIVPSSTPLKTDHTPRLLHTMDSPVFPILSRPPAAPIKLIPVANLPDSPISRGAGMPSSPAPSMKTTATSLLSPSRAALVRALKSSNPQSLDKKYEIFKTEMEGLKNKLKETESKLATALAEQDRLAKLEMTERHRNQELQMMVEQHAVEIDAITKENEFCREVAATANLKLGLSCEEFEKNEIVLNNKLVAVNQELNMIYHLFEKLKEGADRKSELELAAVINSVVPAYQGIMEARHPGEFVTKDN
jgi:hypothetical protein